MGLRRSRGRISEFCDKYGVDISEFASPIDTFNSFNEFFVRKLKAEVRPIESNDGDIVFPADGRHIGFPNLSEVDGIYAKGQRFDVETLLFDPKLGKRFREGSAVISRLCPVDCHRFHYPVSGETNTQVALDGPLRSVSPLALRKGIWRLFSNRRFLTRIENPDIGCVIMVEIGATCVGSIRQTGGRDGSAKRGEEKGYFEFGGSAIITLFESGRVVLAEDLVENTRRSMELYAHYGDRMGEALGIGI